MIESLFRLFHEAFSDRKPPTIVQRQRTRLADMVALARANSPFYRELYRDLPQRVEDASLLPVTHKKELMSRFDDWATDREVTLEKPARCREPRPDRRALPGQVHACPDLGDDR